MTMVLRMLALILSAVQGYGIIVTLINSEAITLGDDSLGVIQKLLYLLLLEQCFLFDLVIKSLIKELVTVYQLLLLEEL